MTLVSRRKALALAAAVPFIGAAAPEPAGLTPTEFAYGPDGGQKLDLYEQPGLTNAPMLLFVHGGAWTIFDKRGVNDLPAFAIRHGVLLASTNHRLAAGADKAAEDVAAAVDWMLREGPKYGGDPKRLYIMGHSSGGHLVALITVDPKYLAAHNRSPADIAGVIGLDGAGYNAAAQIHTPLILFKPPEFAMWVRAFGTQISALSPTLLVKKGQAYPPYLLIYTDHPGGRRFTEEFADKLHGAGAAAAVFEAKDKSHFSLNDDVGKAGDPSGERVALFIQSGKP